MAPGRGQISSRTIYLYFLHVTLLRFSLAQDDESAFLNFSFATEPRSLVAVRSQPAALHCAPSFGSTGIDYDIGWRREGAELSVAESFGRLSILSNGTLLISRATDGDPAAYQCVVRVKKDDAQWTFVSRMAKLEMAVLPRFDEQPTDARASVGDVAAMACRVADAKPPAAVLWYKDNVLIDVEGSARYTVYPVTGTLEIGDVRQSDAAAYKCRLSNADKYRHSTEGELSVRSKDGAGKPPSFVLEPRGQVVREGDTAVFECVANGSPPPDVQWLKDRVALNVAKDDRLSLSGRSTLVLSKVRSTDAGTYMCRAANQHATAEAQAALDVLVPPRLSATPRNTVGKEVTDVEFQCEAEGRPGPSVTWYKNGEKIIASDYFRIEGGALRVLGLVRTDQAVYQCLAENEAGSVQASAQLVVQLAAQRSNSNSSGGSPSDRLAPTAQSTTAATAESDAAAAASPADGGRASAPHRLRTLTTGSRFVTLEWAAPPRGQGVVSGYEVFYKEEGSDRERSQTTTGLQLSVDSLQPDTVYYFRVVATTDGGEKGSSSEPLRVRTLAQQAVPGTVRELRALPLGPGAMAIEWRPPAGDSAVRFYKLYYAKVEHEGQPIERDMETEIVVTSSRYVQHGLDLFTTYAYRVEAFGDLGAGLSSPTVHATTLGDAPSSPPADVKVEVTGTTAAVVRWDEVPAIARNGIITGYQLKFKLDRRGARVDERVISPDTRSYQLNDLLVDTAYVLQLRAINVNGSGPPTAWINFETFEREREENTVPGAPSQLRPHAEARSIAVAWAPPLDDGIMIRGYLVGWGVGVPDSNTAKVDAHARYYKIEGLDPNREYVISMRAYNNAGNGFPIYESVRTLPAGGGGRPGAFGQSGANSAAAYDLYDDYGAHLGGEDADSPLEMRFTPIALSARTLSPTAVRLSWTDQTLPTVDMGPQRPRDGRFYTIRYSNYHKDGGRYRLRNATETTYVVDGLKPATQYEFSVRVSLGHRHSRYSMAALNTTFSAPPSSAPRDLTLVNSPNGDPTVAMLNWQPPKFANGQIVEYLIYYTTDVTQREAEWQLRPVRGDHFSTRIDNLLPQTDYYFKIQARNDKGYGPQSSVVQHRTRGGMAPASGPVTGGGDSQLSGPAAFLDRTSTVVLMVASAAVAVCLISVIGIVVYCCRRGSGRRGGYVAGKRSRKGDVKPPPDLWIDHKCDLVDRNRLDGGGTPSDSMQDLKAVVYPAPGPTHSPDRDTPARYHAVSGGTLSRSYHNQSAGSSLDLQQQQQHQQRGTARSAAPHMASTPHVVYAAAGPRTPHQSARATMELPQTSHYGSVSAAGARHSPYQSSVGLTPTPPPAAPPTCPPMMDGSKTLTKKSAASASAAAAGQHPLSSFSGVHQPPPPPPTAVALTTMGGQGGESPRTHVVRPVPITVAPSPMRQAANGPNAAGGNKPRMVAVPPNNSGRPPTAHSGTGSDATLNASCGQAGRNEQSNCGGSSGRDTDSEQLQHSYSTEELNAQMQNLDTMIDDLHAMQQEFRVV